MKILIACDSFKGTFSSEQIASRIKEAVLKKLPDSEIDYLPISDGGEGITECFSRIMGGKMIKVTVTDPNFLPTEAQFLLCGDVAVVETAQAAGLPMSIPLDTKEKTTYGVGELIKVAEKLGAKKILLGLGGSATTDGGCGMAAALGTIFFDKDNKTFIPVGKNLKNITSIKFSDKHNITALCDVRNPLFGPDGAAYVYGPQKGADKDDVILLDDGLRHLSDILKKNGIDADVPGAGAAGGMGAGVIAFCKGELKRGIDAVLDVADFDKKAADADYIITGEGALDSQSFSGKVIDGILNRSQGTPVIAFVGISKIDDYKKYGISKVFETNKDHLPFNAIMDKLDFQLNDCAERLADYLYTESHR